MYKVVKGSLEYYKNKIADKDRKYFTVKSGSEYPVALINKIPSNLPSIKGQRFLNVPEAIKLLKKAGGYDRGLFRPILVMAVLRDKATEWYDSLRPEEKGQYISMFDHDVEGYEDYALVRFDGQKRGFMANEAENLPYMPIAIVYKMDSIEAGNKAFTDFNDDMLEKISSDSKFINYFFSGNKQAVLLAERLEENNLVISDKEDFTVIPEIWKEDTTKFRVAHNTWKVANEWFDYKDIKSAVSVIQDVLSPFTKPENSRITIDAWFLHGLCKAIEMRPKIVNNPQPRTALIESIKMSYSYNSKKQKAMLESLRDEAEKRAEKDGGIPGGNNGVNTPYIWASVFLCNLNKRGALTTDVYYGTVQGATQLGSFWEDVREKEAQLKAKKQLKQVV